MTRRFEKKSYKWVDDFFNEHINGYKISSGETIQIATAEQKKILERLRENSNVLAPVYAEIERKITDQSTPRSNGCLGRCAVITSIVDAAVLCEGKRSLKKDRKTLETTQGDITKTIEKLIELLDRHAEIQEEGYLTSAAKPCPVHLIERAGLQTGTAERQTLFESYIKPLLKAIDGGLRMGKYMPRFQDVLTALKREIEEGSISGCRPEVDAVSDSRKTSFADFVRGFEDCIRQDRDICYNLPAGFKLTDDSVAAIVTVLFDEDKEADDVKKARKAK